MIRFKKYLTQEMEKGIDNRFIKVVDTLYKHPKDQTVYDIDENFGYNQRHLYRHFKKY